MTKQRDDIIGDDIITGSIGQEAFQALAGGDADVVLLHGEEEKHAGVRLAVAYAPFVEKVVGEIKSVRLAYVIQKDSDHLHARERVQLLCGVLNGVSLIGREQMIGICYKRLAVRRSRVRNRVRRIDLCHQTESQEQRAKSQEPSAQSSVDKHSIVVIVPVAEQEPRRCG